VVAVSFYRSSPDLLAAGERTEQALALARVARGAGAPVVGLSAGAGRNQSAFDFGTSFAGVDVSISPDLWGERRARTRAERARAAAAAQDGEALRRRAAAAIARTVVMRAALTQRIMLLDSSIRQARDVERVVRLRVREGEASRVELGLQAVRARRLEAERLRLTGALEQSRVALALLVGDEAPSFTDTPVPLSSLASGGVAVPAPAQLVSLRPEVRAAEARLVAAGGDLQAARAAFLPSPSLSAGAIAGAAVTGGLNLGASLLAPIFNRGALRGNLNYVSARQREAALLYRQAVLSALADVESAVGALATARERQGVLAQVLAQSQVTATLSRRRYLEGEAGLQEVLDAQDLRIAAEDASALAREEALGATISLWLAAGAPAT
jgi:outer membrane protein TolC